MKRSFFAPVLLALAMLTNSWSVMAEVAVIAHPSNENSPNKAQLIKIFLKKNKAFGDGSPAKPIYQKSGQDISKEFYTKVLHKSASQLKSYWTKLMFTGNGSAPKEVKGADEVIELIANNPSFIGYIDASKVTGEVKVIAKF
ncbi:phosphate ABC transporter substrate-binding protein [Thalassomonas sp. RHCl1]|uniref:phosphate ABC transporter substrate-binding protein n=1 Tax=Thalassomonas sp. RHCl1 TaxID=2995320 RepID=UPI00248CC74B|nr:phosphate ABC transporter substrate-binding protein [Thalassomonas sp. RHCl1]